MSNSLSPRYSIDTSSLIDGYRNVEIQVILENLIRQNRLKAPPAVLRELEVGGDETFRWSKHWERLLIQELTEASAVQLGPLVDKYGEPFRDSQDPGKIYRGLIKKGTASDADPDVIALALNHGWTVVTGETSGIKGACKLERIPCISLKKLIQREQWQIEQQIPLLGEEY